MWQKFAAQKRGKYHRKFQKVAETLSLLDSRMIRKIEAQFAQGVDGKVQLLEFIELVWQQVKTLTFGEELGFVETLCFLFMEADADMSIIFE